MTQPERQDHARLIAELEAAGVSLHKQSLLLLQLGCMCQFTQLQRIRDHQQKSVDHFMGQCLKAVHAEYVARETLQP